MNTLYSGGACRGGRMNKIYQYSSHSFLLADIGISGPTWKNPHFQFSFQNLCTHSLQTLFLNAQVPSSYPVPRIHLETHNLHLRPKHLAAERQTKSSSYFITSLLIPRNNISPLLRLVNALRYSGLVGYGLL